MYSIVKLLCLLENHGKFHSYLTLFTGFYWKTIRISRVKKVSQPRDDLPISVFVKVPEEPRRIVKPRGVLR